MAPLASLRDRLRRALTASAPPLLSESLVAGFESSGDTGQDGARAGMVQREPKHVDSNPRLLPVESRVDLLTPTGPIQRPVRMMKTAGLCITAAITSPGALVGPDCSGGTYLLSLTAVIIAALAATPTAAHAEDDTAQVGFRWGRASTICVYRVGPTKPGYLVKQAVEQYNNHPDLRMEFHKPTTCASYAQRIQIREFKYGADKSPAWTWFTGKTFPTPCLSSCDVGGWYWGADQYGTRGWLMKSHPTIRINESYRWSYASYRAAVAHEIGHAIGRGHTERCDSVMSTTAA
jgi:hypothetical protein